MHHSKGVCSGGVKYSAKGFTALTLIVHSG